MGKEVYSVAKRSPLHPDVEVDKQLIPITLELHQLALHVGRVFGLDIYGLDVVETPHGLVAFQGNDRGKQFRSSATYSLQQPNERAASHGNALAQLERHSLKSGEIRYEDLSHHG